MSISLSLSFFSRLLGVATPPAEAAVFAKLAAAGLWGCSCLVALGSFSLVVVWFCLRSETEDPDDGFEGGLGAGPEATSPGDTLDPRAGDRLSRVVLARLRASEDFGDLWGVRWEVERSREGVSGVGGVGAGR